MKIATLTALLLLSGWANAAPPAQPVLKSGACPSGYYGSGNYCVPSGSNSRFALPRTGSCPSGYYASSNYCVASSDSSRAAIPKLGSCPGGFYGSGDYCVSSK